MLYLQQGSSYRRLFEDEFCWQRILYGVAVQRKTSLLRWSVKLIKLQILTH